MSLRIPGPVRERALPPSRSRTGSGVLVPAFMTCAGRGLVVSDREAKTTATARSRRRLPC